MPVGRRREIVSGNLKILYVIGDIPLRKRPKNVDFLVVQHSHFTELSKDADIVLPSTTFFETEGSIVDCFGRLKYLNRVIEPESEAKSHKDIFIKLSKIMGNPIKKTKGRRD